MNKQVKWNEIADAFDRAVKDDRGSASNSPSREVKLPMIRRKKRPPIPRGHNSTCLKRGCSEPVYYDVKSKVWWSFCIYCLYEAELGPFFKRIPHNTEYD